RPLRPDHRGGRHGARAARGHQLDTGTGRVLNRSIVDRARPTLQPNGTSPLSQDLASLAKERGIRYFMISYTDLFGAQRAKLVPAAAIADMQRDGAGFAGFATYLDLTPAHPDLFAVPDAAAMV